MTSPMEAQRLDLESGRARIDDDGNVVHIERTSWEPVDLAPVLNGTKRDAEPKYLKRSDGKSLLYPGKPHVFFGPSESLKSWAAMLAAKAFLDDGLKVLYLDFESTDVWFVTTARTVGIPDGYLGDSFQYIRPEEPLYYTDRSRKLTPNGDAEWGFLAAREMLKPSLIILDGVTEAYSMHGWSINAAEDAALFQAVFGRWGDDVASIAIDHSGKDAERGQIGSQHKRAGLDGAAYEFTSLCREGRGGHSIAAIRISKDRHGSVRAFAPDGYIGALHVTNEKVWLQSPRELSADEAAAKVDEAAQNKEKLVTWLRENPGQPEAAIVRGTGMVRNRVVGLLASLRINEQADWVEGPRKAHLWSLTVQETVSEPDSDRTV